MPFTSQGENRLICRVERISELRDRPCFSPPAVATTSSCLLFFLLTCCTVGDRYIRKKKDREKLAAGRKVDDIR